MQNTKFNSVFSSSNFSLKESDVKHLEEARLLAAMYTV